MKTCVSLFVKKKIQYDEVKNNVIDKNSIVAHMNTYITSPSIHSRLIDSVINACTAGACSTQPSLENLTDICLELKLSRPPLESTLILFRQFIQFCILNWGAFPNQKDTDDSYKFYLLQDRFPMPAELTTLADFNEIYTEDTVELSTTVVVMYGSFKFKKCADEPKSNLECSICLKELVDGDDCIILPCMHIFHHGTVDATLCQGALKWVKENNLCPICKLEV
jgi:hypothetical protein